jgi:hypothetical protein
MNVARSECSSPFKVEFALEEVKPPIVECRVGEKSTPLGAKYRVWALLEPDNRCG